ncbi:hypothetical protein KIN20_024724 [Parelaphostrongylus tenuis]|uniref:Uncharacterized protein n=1 Tax=Parelaphostrongylus tenuis TaxID=148309 RepID=A0AAD5QXN3_PARTN|nr:hypothetical protein KIN20_024724 [Parelaphostrongylus tenuis]
MRLEDCGLVAKLARGQHLYNEDAENEAMMRKSKSRRRRSSGENELAQQMASTGVNTTARRVTSADAVRESLAKTTSTSDLTTITKVKTYDKIDRIIREEIQKIIMPKAKSEKPLIPKQSGDKDDAPIESSGRGQPDGAEDRQLNSFPDIDDEFEDLPPISDSGDELSDEEKQKENYASHHHIRKEDDDLDELTSESHSGKPVLAVKSSKAKTANKKSNRPIHMRDDDSVEVYEDDWEEMGANRPAGKDASRRYIHEKSIFQELTHLKKMQIQYGRVQERVLVRSLVNNFCKMHGLDPARFKFQTFYSWEKFLYDTLSDQLKLIYMEERARLAQASTALPARAITINRFETRLRQAQAVPLVSERLQRLNQVYGASTMTLGKATIMKKSTRAESGNGKRCDCLRKHLLIKQES